MKISVAVPTYNRDDTLVGDLERDRKIKMEFKEGREKTGGSKKGTPNKKI